MNIWDNSSQLTNSYIFQDAYCTTNQPFLVGFHAISGPSPGSRGSREAFGLRPELERWVLRLALRKAEQWPQKARPRVRRVEQMMVQWLFFWSLMVII